MNSCSFQISDFEAFDSNDNSIYFNINNVKRRYPVRLIVDKEKCDFNNDTWINDVDFQMILDAFGSSRGDDEYKYQFDLCKTEGSKNRIDFEDIFIFFEVKKEQDRIQNLLSVK